MLDSCEFYLEFGFGALCMLIEDFENKIYSISTLSTDITEFFVDSIGLFGFHDISDDKNVSSENLHGFFYFLDFARTEIRTIVRLGAFLDSVDDYHTSQCLYERC